MAVNKISDLLPISDKNADPNAYEVFGLQVGESDREIINRAVDAVITKVKAAKSETDTVLWKRAAGIVQAARVTLSDPERKSRLDAQLGRVAAPPTEPVDSKPVDPLAALLPPVHPMRPVVPEPTASESPMQMPPGLFQTPVVHEDGAPLIRNAVPPAKPATPVKISVSPVPAPPNPAPPIPAPPAPETPNTAHPTIRNDPRRLTRRRKSVFVPIIMSIITLALMAMVGLLAYALFFREGTIAISSEDGRVKIDTSHPAQTRSRISEPVVSDAKTMPRELPPARTNSLSRFPMRDDFQFDSDVNSVVEEPITKVSPQEVKPNTEPTSTTGMMSPPSPPMETPIQQTPAFFPTETDDKAVAKLVEVRLAIRKADWAGMVALAESVNEMQLSPEQKTDAENLLSVADLATYYREGIERAIADLNAGDDFEVKNGFRVVVVGTTDHSLTIRYNTKMPEYNFDALPLSLAHRLATFQIPAGPNGDAGKAVYQAVAPKSTPGHRTEAMEWLSEIDQPIEGANRDALIQTIQSIFAEN